MDPIAAATQFISHKHKSGAPGHKTRSPIYKNTYLTLPVVAAAVAKLLLNMKLRLAAVKVPREAVLNNLGRTIVCLQKLGFTLDKKKSEHWRELYGFRCVARPVSIPAGRFRTLVVANGKPGRHSGANTDFIGREGVTRSEDGAVELSRAGRIRLRRLGIQ